MTKLSPTNFLQIFLNFWPPKATGLRIRRHRCTICNIGWGGSHLGSGSNLYTWVEFNSSHLNLQLWGIIKGLVYFSPFIYRILIGDYSTRGFLIIQPIINLVIVAYSRLPHPQLSYTSSHSSLPPE